MLNQVILVGRIAKIQNMESEEKPITLDLAVTRSYKNEEGIYETDFINCILFNPISKTTIEYCKVGDVIGIKGRLQTYNKEIQIIAERVTFLSSKKNETNEE